MNWEKLHKILSTHDHVAGWEWLHDETDRPSNVLRIFWSDGGYDDVASAATAAEAVRDKAKALGYPWLPEGRGEA
jgi:hypothetical protein